VSQFRASDCFGSLQVTAHIDAKWSLLAYGINERHAMNRPAHAFVYAVQRTLTNS